MTRTIIFIHGMFQNPVSWEPWINFFSERGYNCLAPAWPFHHGVPADLRQSPPEGLGDLGLPDVLAAMEQCLLPLGEKPIVIGHSVGGLVTQLLAAKGLIAYGVPISSVAPNAMLSFDWNFFKNAVTITNPLKGDSPMLQTAESFHENFCNTLSTEEAERAFQQTATHDSRNVLRDCMLGPGHINLDMPHVPLLFIAGDKDHIVPHELVEKNSKAYTDEQSRAMFRLFNNRSHFICGEPGWQEVATFIYQWLEEEKGV